MTYTHLTQEQRYQIQALLKTSLKQNVIAKIVGVSPPTISRELKRNRGLRGYRAHQAQRFADERRGCNARRISADTWQFVDTQLREQWSPEQIAAKALVSHESIYQYVYANKRNGGDLWRNLRCQKPRRKRQGQYDRRGKIADRRSISSRPRIVQSRRRLGDWEADTIIGKNHKHAIVSLNERKSGVILIAKIDRKTATNTARAINKLLKPNQNAVKTITSDNGKEFAHHKRIEKKLNADFYFADPYSSWQRGSNENGNGLIRQYFPKHRDFTTITQEEIDEVMDKLNNRPRKRLKFKTPNQVFKKITGVALRY